MKPLFYIFLWLSFFPIATFAQIGLENFTQLAEGNQQKIASQLNPLPNDLGRNSQFSGTLYSPLYLDEITQPTSSVSVITADLAVKKGEWTIEDLLDIENQAVVKKYTFNEKNQLLERFDYQPERQHAAKKYSSRSDTKWEYQYADGNMVWLKTHYCIEESTYKPGEIIATEKDFFGNTSVRNYLKDGNTETGYLQRNSDPQQKVHEYRFDESGRLVYSLYIHNTGRIERDYFFDKNGRLEKWVQKDYKLEANKERLLESVIHTISYNDMGLWAKKERKIEGNEDFFVNTDYAYSFSKDDDNRLVIQMISTEESPSGTINYATTFVFDQYNNWIFRSIKSLRKGTFIEVMGRKIEY